MSRNRDDNAEADITTTSDAQNYWYSDNDMRDLCSNIARNSSRPDKKVVYATNESIHNFLENKGSQSSKTDVAEADVIILGPMTPLEMANCFANLADNKQNDSQKKPYVIIGTVNVGRASALKRSGNHWMSYMITKNNDDIQLTIFDSRVVQNKISIDSIDMAAISLASNYGKDGVSPHHRGFIQSYAMQNDGSSCGPIAVQTIHAAVNSIAGSNLPLRDAANAFVSDSTKPVRQSPVFRDKANIINKQKEWAIEEKRLQGQDVALDPAIPLRIPADFVVKSEIDSETGSELSFMTASSEGAGKAAPKSEKPEKRTILTDAEIAAEALVSIKHSADFKLLSEENKKDLTKYVMIHAVTPKLWGGKGEFVEYVGEDGEKHRAFKILEVEPGSPAEKAGFKKGQVITKLINSNGKDLEFDVENDFDMIIALRSNHFNAFNVINEGGEEAEIEISEGAIEAKNTREPVRALFTQEEFDEAYDNAKKKYKEQKNIVENAAADLLGKSKDELPENSPKEEEAINDFLFYKEMKSAGVNIDKTPRTKAVKQAIRELRDVISDSTKSSAEENAENPPLEERKPTFRERLAAKVAEKLNQPPAHGV